MAEPQVTSPDSSRNAEAVSLFESSRERRQQGFDVRVICEGREAATLRAGRRRSSVAVEFSYPSSNR